MAKAIVDAWLDAEYIGSGRHERRVNMIEEEAAKYNKYRDSYKTVTSSINFVKNTSANRNNILKANTRTAK